MQFCIHHSKASKPLERNFEPRRTSEREREKKLNFSRLKNRLSLLSLLLLMWIRKNAMFHNLLTKYVRCALCTVHGTFTCSKSVSRRFHSLKSVNQSVWIKISKQTYIYMASLNLISILFANGIFISILYCSVIFV